MGKWTLDHLLMMMMMMKVILHHLMIKTQENKDLVI